MKKLRLLLFEDCFRFCPGCCNKDWDLKALPVCTSYKEYDQILLTGGEPMLYPDIVLGAIKKIRRYAWRNNPRIYVYTADVTHLFDVQCVIEQSDGICLTLHDHDDVHSFYKLDFLLERKSISTYNKSMRLNIFEGIDVGKISRNRWIVKKNIKWIKNCPLPKDEVFMRYC